MSLSKSQWLRLAKMIVSEQGCAHYEIPERFTPIYLDLGYIELKKWSEKIPFGIIDFSQYVTTYEGRKAYNDWFYKSEQVK